MTFNIKAEARNACVRLNIPDAGPNLTVLEEVLERAVEETEDGCTRDVCLFCESGMRLEHGGLGWAHVRRDGYSTEPCSAFAIHERRRRRREESHE
jgi:hypothetical protein